MEGILEAPGEDRESESDWKSANKACVIKHITTGAPGTYSPWEPWDEGAGEFIPQPISHGWGINSLALAASPSAGSQRKPWAKSHKRQSGAFWKGSVWGEGAQIAPK